MSKLFISSNRHWKVLVFYLLVGIEKYNIKVLTVLSTSLGKFFLFFFLGVYFKYKNIFMIENIFNIRI